MKLSDIMSSMRLSSYAEVALVLFFAAFVAITISVLRNGRRAEWERASRLPLSGDEPPPPEGNPSHARSPQNSTVENVRP